MKQKDETKKDTYFIKLTGKAEIPYKLETGDKVGIAIEGAITAVTESDNHDGSFTYYAKFIPMIVKMVDKHGTNKNIMNIHKTTEEEFKDFMKDTYWIGRV